MYLALALKKIPRVSKICTSQNIPHVDKIFASDWSEIIYDTCCAWAGGTFFRCHRNISPAHSRSAAGVWYIVLEFGW